MNENNKAVELTDEELAKVVGGFKMPSYGLPEECASCTPASAQYQNCTYRNSNSSYCKYVQ